MVTAADGAEKFYSGDNNVARYETVEEAWVGHPHFSIIENLKG